MKQSRVKSHEANSSQFPCMTISPYLSIQHIRSGFFFLDRMLTGGKLEAITVIYELI